MIDEICVCTSDKATFDQALLLTEHEISTCIEKDQQICQDTEYARHVFKYMIYKIMSDREGTPPEVILAKCYKYLTDNKEYVGESIGKTVDSLNKIAQEKKEA